MQEPPVPTPYYRIDQVAARTGLTKRTIRYYEEVGVLDPQFRSEGNYRRYSEADVARLERICRFKEALGLTLAETKEMVRLEETRDELRTQFQQTVALAAQLEQISQANTIAQQQLALIDTKLQALQELRNEVLFRLERLTERRTELANQLAQATPDAEETPTLPPL